MVKYPCDNLIAGLVAFKIGTWREVCEMDIEDAINTYMILYIDRFNENLMYENAQKNNKK